MSLQRYRFFWNNKEYLRRNCQNPHVCVAPAGAGPWRTCPSPDGGRGRGPAETSSRAARTQETLGRAGAQQAEKMPDQVGHDACGAEFRQGPVPTGADPGSNITCAGPARTERKDGEGGTQRDWRQRSQFVLAQKWLCRSLYGRVSAKTRRIRLVLAHKRPLNALQPLFSARMICDLTLLPRHPGPAATQGV